MIKPLKYLHRKYIAFVHKTRGTPTPAPIKNIQAERVSHWINDNGDKTHRLDYNLNESSVVFDLGGYEGQWASDIFSKYTCHVHIFEPFVLYAENIRLRFKMNPKIKVYAYGLSNLDTIAKLTVNNDASSVFKTGGETVDIKLVKFEDFITTTGINHIDLIKINIEGGEYELLEHLIEKNLVGKIQNIQVQFHDFVPNAAHRMKEIQKQLQLTHKLTYQYEFVWENWTLLT
ncbi:hypothetical protein BH09BAC6_BH09BAC6_17250 [soil metagenome]|jgi:FkbM family methyltransferase